MADAPPSPQDVQAVTQASLIYATSLMVILFWDYLNTLHLEVRYVWLPLFSANQRRQWSKAGAENRIYMLLSPVLFFVVRYLALAEFAIAMGILYSPGGLSPGACVRIQRFFPLGSVVIALAASALMSLRVIALWENAAYIKWPLLFTWTATAAVAVWGATFTTARVVGTTCVPTQTSAKVNAFYLSIAVFDAIVVALTLLRALRIRTTQFGATGPLFRIMVRDGLLYFVLIFSANMLAAAFQLQDLNPLIKPINATLATIMTSIFGSRIYFNIRAEVYRLRNPRAHFARYADELLVQRPRGDSGGDEEEDEDDFTGAGGERLSKRDSDRTIVEKQRGNKTGGAGWTDAAAIEEAKLGDTTSTSTRNNSVTYDLPGGGKHTLASPVRPIWTTRNEHHNGGAQLRSYDPNSVNFDAVMHPSGSEHTVTHLADTLSPIAAKTSFHDRRQANAEKSEPITRNEWA